MELLERDFWALRDLIHQRLGICLGDQKRGLVENRLRNILIEKGFPSFADYFSFLERDGSKDALTDLAERISTNFTFFFRGPAHFAFLKNHILPDLRRRLHQNGTLDLRIWSSACSSGEEPYSIMMTLLDFFGEEYARINGGLLATDISARALEQARQGIYPTERLRDVPPLMIQRFFRQQSPDTRQIREAVREQVTFRSFNLMSRVFPFRKPFQLIFCRNVMIYFDPPTRRELVARLYDQLEPGGYLFTGHSETLREANTAFRFIQPAMYQKPQEE